MSLFDAYKKASQEKFGAKLIGVHGEEVVRGIRLPAFSLMYLFHSNVLPQSKIIGIAGDAASCKSSLGFEIQRWITSDPYYGYAQLIETENKYNPKYHGSITGEAIIDQTGPHCRVQFSRGKTVEECQRIISHFIEFYQDSGHDTPFCMVLDSLSGPPSEEDLKNIAKLGHATKSFPAAANIWNTYFKKISNDLDSLPVYMIIINHLKEDVSAQVGPYQEKPKTKQGGASQDFHAMFYFYMSKKGAIKTANRTGSLIGMKSYKCGLGPNNRKIEVPILWSHTEQGVPPTYWDWHAATSKLLVDKNLDNRIREVSDVVVNANRYSSKRLGLSMVSDTEMGQAVMADDTFLSDILKAADIHQWTVFPQHSSATLQELRGENIEVPLEDAPVDAAPKKRGRKPKVKAEVEPEVADIGAALEDVLTGGLSDDS